MPIEVIASDQTAVYLIDDGDDVVLLPGVAVTSSSEGVLATGDGALSLTLLGSVVAVGTAVTLGDDPAAVAALDVLVGKGATVRTILGSAGIDIRRSGADVTNEGHIFSAMTAIRFAAGSESATLTNGGLLSAGVGDGISFAGAAGGLIGLLSVQNSGTISAGATAVLVAEESLHMVNSGILQSGGDGVALTGAGALVLVNAGLILAQGHAVLSSHGADEVRNSGTLSGEVLLGGGADLLVNAGLVLGDVDLGDGDDRFFGGTGRVAGDVAGGAGNDTLLSGATEDTLSGGDGNDLIRAAGGADEVMGGNGNDRLYGGDGDDDMDGGGNADLVYAGSGADAVRGGIGQDTLFGGDGDDLIYGGTDRDLLHGNAGDDLFVFFAVSNSTTTASDTIRDFVQGEDRVDLDELAPGDLAFAGGAAHAGGGTGSVRLTVNAAGTTTIRIDVDGDAISDMFIFVRGVSGLTAGDFIL